MGYNTTFKGELKFTSEPTASQLAALNEFLGEDCRDHVQEWGERDGGYIDLVLTKDYTGLKWDDGTEKTYALEKSVNVVIREMRKRFPEFGLTGTLVAQGEDPDDRWALTIGADGFATRSKIAVLGDRVTCPSCKHRFIAEVSA